MRARSLRRHATFRFPFAQRLAGRGSLPSSWAQRVRFLPALLRTAAVVALIFALARPQAGGLLRDTAEGIAIEMVLDVSGSMAETDFALQSQWVRRVDAVKRVFRDFVLGQQNLPGRANDLIGMVSFARYADVKCPLTRDQANLVNLLEATDIPGWVQGVQRYRHPEADNTALGDAIVLGTDELRRAGEQAIAGIAGAEPAKSKVMILLTDGADNPAPDARRDAPKPVEAAKLAAALGIKIYTIGAVGAERRAQTSFDFFRRPTAGVDEGTLQEIARVTGGRYFRATDTESLVMIYDEIDKLERRRTGEREYYDDLGVVRTALAVALALLTVEVLLVNTRFRRMP
ncbi:MAG: VWA domain-containing protein [Armatimonadetes bacterium]|nr:VWA domain-containing protein [Armatimonadota bacterium]